jgi:hypothetical protein
MTTDVYFIVNGSPVQITGGNYNTGDVSLSGGVKVHVSQIKAAVAHGMTSGTELGREETQELVWAEVAEADRGAIASHIATLKRSERGQYVLDLLAKLTAQSGLLDSSNARAVQALIAFSFNGYSGSVPSQIEAARNA